MSNLSDLLASPDLLAHGQCLLWRPELLWLHAISDSLIAMAYYSIPITLGYFLYKRRDMAFSWMFLLFGIFIFLCGTTHVVSIWTLWEPVYWLEGMIKVVTAGFSVATAILLVPLVPKAIALPNRAQLETVNAELRKEVFERTKSAAIVLSSQDAIVSADGNGIIISWNKGAQHIFGYEEAEVLGKPLQLLMPERYRDAHRQGMERLLSTGESRVVGKTVELHGLRKDGGEFPLELSLSTWMIGRRTFFSGIIRDTTERKQAEEDLRRLNARLVAVNEELEAFSYSVSHDLRAPLRHINGFTELLKTHAASRLDETGQLYMNTIMNSAKRMGDLIDDLLIFSRMGKAEMRVETVDLAILVQEAMNGLHDEVAGREVSWQIGNLPAVRGDATLLRQVLVNLMANAVKYTRTRTRAEIEIGSRRDGQECVLFVRDNGVGFDMQYAGKLFGVFQRLHHSTEFEGTGVGLANVRRIIQRHGGRTWAEGRVDGGATFYFSLPDKTEQPGE